MSKPTHGECGEKGCTEQNVRLYGVRLWPSKEVITVVLCPKHAKQWIGDVK